MKKFKDSNVHELIEMGLVEVTPNGFDIYAYDVEDPETGSELCLSNFSDSKYMPIVNFGSSMQDPVMGIYVSTKDYIENKNITKDKFIEYVKFSDLKIITLTCSDFDEIKKFLIHYDVTYTDKEIVFEDWVKNMNIYYSNIDDSKKDDMYCALDCGYGLFENPSKYKMNIVVNPEIFENIKSWAGKYNCKPTTNRLYIKDVDVAFKIFGALFFKGGIYLDNKARYESLIHSEEKEDHIYEITFDNFIMNDDESFNLLVEGSPYDLYTEDDHVVIGMITDIPFDYKIDVLKSFEVGGDYGYYTLKFICDAKIASKFAKYVKNNCIECNRCDFTSIHIDVNLEENYEAYQYFIQLLQENSSY